jgi:pimeloyl-ACP methyl ester carboxylesterase
MKFAPPDWTTPEAVYPGEKVPEVSWTVHRVELSTGPVIYHVCKPVAPTEALQPLLHLHGAGSVRHAHGLEALGRDFELICPVCPGFDRTPRHAGVDDMKSLGRMWGEFIEKVVGKPVDLVGISFGGWSALWVALESARWVDQLILENPAGFRLPHLPPLSNDPAIRMREMYVYPDRLPKNDRPLDLQEQNRQTMDGYHPGVRCDQIAIDRIGEIGALTLICHGTKDGRVAAESVRMLKAGIKRSHLVYVYDAGHSLESDQGERFARLVGDFCRRAEAFIVHPGHHQAAE